MKKIDIYKIRSLFQKIDSDYKNDVGIKCRATKINDSIHDHIIFLINQAVIDLDNTACGAGWHSPYGAVQHQGRKNLRSRADDTQEVCHRKGEGR